MKVVLNDSLAKLKALSNGEIPIGYRNLLGKGVRVASLLPPKHRRALKWVLENDQKQMPQKVVGIVGGRGCLKSSFGSLVSMFRSLHGDVDTVVLCKNYQRCKFNFDQFAWTLRLAKAEAGWETRFHPILTFTYSHYVPTGKKGNFRHILSHVYFVPAEDENRLRGFLFGKNVRFVWVDDGLEVNYKSIKPLSEDLRCQFLATFSVPDVGCFATEAYRLFTCGKLFRFTYHDVPTKYLGKNFFTSADLFRNYNENAYIAQYEGIPVAKTKMEKLLYRRDIELIRKADKF